jgi:hypothetical protein
MIIIFSISTSIHKSLEVDFACWKPNHDSYLRLGNRAIGQFTPFLDKRPLIQNHPAQLDHLSPEAFNHRYYEQWLAA